MTATGVMPTWATAGTLLRAPFGNDVVATSICSPVMQIEKAFRPAGVEWPPLRMRQAPWLSGCSPGDTIGVNRLARSEVPGALIALKSLAGAPIHAVDGAATHLRRPERASGRQLVSAGAASSSRHAPLSLVVFVDNHQQGRRSPLIRENRHRGDLGRTGLVEVDRHFIETVACAGPEVFRSRRHRGRRPTGHELLNRSIDDF